MLENAGAVIGCPVERDFQSAEVIVDNDGGNRRGVYAETDGGGQRLCYDFECTDADGEPLHVLVDAKTGRQFKIVF